MKVRFLCITAKHGLPPIHLNLILKAFRVNKAHKVKLVLQVQWVRKVLKVILVLPVLPELLVLPERKVTKVIREMLV